MEASGVLLYTEEGEYISQDIHDEWLDEIDASISGFQKKKYSGILRNSFLEDLNGSLINFDENAEVYIIETPSGLYATDEIKRKNPDSKIIYLSTNWRLFGLQPYNLRKNGVNNTLRAVNELIDSFILKRKIRKNVDGIITISRMMKEKISAFFPNKPIQIVKPLPKKKIESSPELGSHNAIFVGQNRDHKGVDILVREWEKVREEIPDAQLFLVGDGHKEEWQSVEGVHIEGFVENLDEIYSKCELYIHPARHDGFAASVVEAMNAGFPAIVTENTGIKSEVKEIDDKCVVLKKDEMHQKITKYFSKSLKEKKRLSYSSEKIAERLYDNSQGKFEQKLKNLLEN